MVPRATGADISAKNGVGMKLCPICHKVIRRTACACEAIKGERERVARRCIEIAKEARVRTIREMKVADWIVWRIREEFGL